MVWIRSISVSLSFSLLILFFPEKFLSLFRRSFSSQVVASLTSVSASQLRNGSRTVFKPVACHKEQKKRWFYVVTLSSRIRSLACTEILALGERNDPFAIPWAQAEHSSFVSWFTVIIIIIIIIIVIGKLTIDFANWRKNLDLLLNHNIHA